MKDIQKMEERFLEAITRCKKSKDVSGSIGTLGEKTLHSTLKYYYEPNMENHEIKIGPYVADICNEKGIVEIQTRNFSAMRKKLEYLLKTYPVTIVYPVSYTKWLYWIDETTGMISKKRKSPKQGTPLCIFYELYRIKHLLNHPNLSLDIILLNMEEYRLLNGWSEDRKRGSERYELIPIALKEQMSINSIEDYKKLIPKGLPDTYSSKDFKKASGLSLHHSQTALNILTYLGVVKRIGKRGNSYLYQN